MHELLLLPTMMIGLFSGAVNVDKE